MQGYLTLILGVPPKYHLFFSCKSSLDLELVRVQLAEEGFNDIGEDEKTIKLKKFPPKKDNFVVDQCGCDWWFIGIALFLLAIFVMLIFFQLSCNCLQTVFEAQKLKLKLTTHYLREGFKKKRKKSSGIFHKGGKASFKKMKSICGRKLEGGGSPRGKKIFWMIQTMFKNKKKKYGNGPKIGRNPPPLWKIPYFFFFY